jgi:hypothetical protein
MRETLVMTHSNHIDVVLKPSEDKNFASLLSTAPSQHDRTDNTSQSCYALKLYKAWRVQRNGWCEHSERSFKKSQKSV